MVCYVKDPLNDSVLLRNPDLASDFLEFLEEVKPVCEERFVQVMTCAHYDFARACGSPHFFANYFFICISRILPYLSFRLFVP